MMEGYFLAATKAVGTLFREQLPAHTLVIIYSTIDTCGLLDAPAGQNSATGASFKAWVKKYMLNFPGIEFTEVDLWAARCAVLHTFTSESDLSKSGAARQLQYYTGEKTSPHIQHLISITKSHENGSHLPVHFGDLCESFFQGLKSFFKDFEAICLTSSAHQERLRKVLQTHAHPIAH